MLDQVYVETPTTIATAPVPIPVPEPATAVLFGAGLIGLLLARRRGWPFVGTAPAAALQARLPALPVRSRTPARTAAAKARRTRRRTATRRRRTVGVYPAMNPNFPAR
jgi:hypothetical protein